MKQLQNKKGFSVAVIALAILAVVGAAAVSRSDTKPASAWDQFQTDPNNKTNTPAQTPTSQAVTRLLTAIIVVVVLGSVAIWASKKYIPKITAIRGKNVKLLETVTLAPQRHLHLVQVGVQKFLIGSSADSVRMLADVTLSLEDQQDTKDETSK